MLAMRRIAKVIGRTTWLMSSMKNISGLMNQAIHQGTFGPKKCEKYFTTPCSFTPYTWVATKITIAMANVVLRLSVGGRKPGIKPSAVEPITAYGICTNLDKQNNIFDYIAGLAEIPDVHIVVVAPLEPRHAVIVAIVVT